MQFSPLRRRPRWIATGVLATAFVAIAAGAALGVVGGDAFYQRGSKPKTPSEFGTAPLADAGSKAELLARNDFFMSRRTAGDTPLDSQKAGALRAAAAQQANRLRKQSSLPLPAGPATFDAPWTAIGPNPIVQQTRNPDGGIFSAMAGRVGALAIRPSNGKFILGGAQGGIWLYDSTAKTWSPKTDGFQSLATGALMVAPSNDAIVYAGTGEGHLSGDSYFGNGVLKSTDGGENWSHVSGDYFVGVAISRLIVDPANANHVYVAVLRGRGGARRVTPPDHSKFGIWESTDGGVSWTLLKEAKNETNGATDLEMDPQSPQILYASFWSDAIYKSTNGGQSWSPIMNGIPGSAGQHAANLTRFELGLSHPAEGSAVLYAGFDWVDGAGYHPSRVFKSTNEGASWVLLPAGAKDGDSVEDYCGGQCFYDNNVDVDPNNPDIVHVSGQFDYGIGSGGTFRSDDGGQTWIDLGYDQHPDFQAFSFNPANPSRIINGSDGGVWTSPDRGGRPQASDPLSAVTWENLNGSVDPVSPGVILGRTNLQIAQFTSIATVPTVPLRFWGGTQDNGTLRKSGGGNHWFDVASGDGGQVIVDHTPDTCVLGPSCFVYGTYFGISPYRYTDGGGFFSNQSITNGINLSDRSTFYIPMTINRANPNQLYLGTYRLYRTDNARAASAGSVAWEAVSPDLTGGCAGTAPNGARGCVLSAIGVGGGEAVYTGSEDGLVYVSSNAQTSASPSWERVDIGELPKRPVTQFAVDRSNYRTAYVAYAGFNAATPSRPGHVFRTTDGGQNWTDVTGNLPDSPVNSIILDPSFPNTLYVGTDVGSMVTYDGGANWARLGSGTPNVAVWQLDLDPYNRVLAAGTHGRGAWRLGDSTTVPSLVVSKIDAGVPVGPASQLTYTLTVKNIGNADATGVTVSDPVPANSTFVSATNGGTFANGTVTWSGLSVPKGAAGVGGSVQLSFTVSIADALKNKVKSLTNDGVVVTSAEGPGATGSPFITPIAPPYAVSLAPATQTDGGRVGTSVDYHVTLTNNGFNADTYSLSSSGGTWTVSFLDSTCTNPLGATTPSVLPGGTTDVCVRVAVPANAANDASNTATVAATSVGGGATGSATIRTIAVAVDTLLVDNDGNIPDVQPIYQTALAAVPHSTWDLSVDGNLPLQFLTSFKNVVWFTGNSYPGPITPYEAKLASFLDGGGNLFMNGQDILDQAAGTTAFVHDYLHITWDGTETQNDKATANVTGEAGNPVGGGVGTVPLDHTVLGAAFEDRLTLNGTATVAFRDDSNAPNGLTFSGTYKVVFLAFPLEAYGSPAQKVDLVGRVMTFFGP
jgi:uncharacterized repeat protein (TIGR01451 family)